jgi:hypothetical protein
VLVRDGLYVTDDGGRSWQPMFHGLSRRTFQQAAFAPPARVGGAPRWLVVTSGEVWSTETPAPEAPDARAEHLAWAQRRLRWTPSLDATIDSVLGRLRLSAGDINGVIGALRARHYVPVLDARLWSAPWSADDTAARTGTSPYDRDAARVNPLLGFFLFATWSLPESNTSREEGGALVAGLYELRRQISFAVEDAWHERTVHLRWLGAGATDTLQRAVLRERVVVLESLIETWSREPLTQTALRAARLR